MADVAMKNKGEQYVILEWSDQSEMMGLHAYWNLVREGNVDLRTTAVRFVDKHHLPLNLYYKFGRRR